MKKTRHRKGNAFPVWELLKAALFGSILTVVLMLLFCLMLYWGWFSDGAIAAANVVIKLLSAALAGLWMGKAKEAVWWHGGMAAVGYFVFSTVLMAVFLGSFSFQWNLLADALLCFVCGAAVFALVRRFFKKQQQT